MLKKLFIITGSLLALLLIVIGSANYNISDFSKNKLYSNSTIVPYNKVGLLLGTSKYASNGINLYYKYRVQAAVTLYNNKKISYILVSGDNSDKSYNEPKKIKEDLIKAGIPKDLIVLDYAGFRTLDSVIRASKVFGETNFTIISQQFHNERAVFLAHKFGNNAIGFNAQSVSKSYGFKVQFREYFARVKVYLDLILNVQPKFLGDPISIG